MCLSPVFVSGKGLVPCNHCDQCFHSRQNDWLVRCYYESLNYEKKCYVTLTYDEEHIRPDYSLDKQALQDFIGRVRFYFSKKNEKYNHGDIRQIKYLASGEYGEKGGRPHYHIIFFGISPDEFFYLDGIKVSTCIFFRKKWGNGFQLKVLPYSEDAVRYVTKYCVKDSSIEVNSRHRLLKIGYHEYPEKRSIFTGQVFPAFRRKYFYWVNPETCCENIHNFTLFSKGLGSCFFDKVSLEEFSKFEFIKIGKYKYSIPRYYIKLARKVDPSFKLGRVSIISSPHSEYSSDAVFRLFLHRDVISPFVFSHVYDVSSFPAVIRSFPGFSSYFHDTFLPLTNFDSVRCNYLDYLPVPQFLYMLDTLTISLYDFLTRDSVLFDKYFHVYSFDDFINRLRSSYQKYYDRSIKSRHSPPRLSFSNFSHFESIRDSTVKKFYGTCYRVRRRSFDEFVHFFSSLFEHEHLNFITTCFI